MKFKKIMKETIDQDFNRTENYVKIIDNVKVSKKSNKYKLAIVGVAVFALGVTAFQYLPHGQSKSSNSYFLTSIQAEEKVYDSDEKIVFETVAKENAFDSVSSPEIGELYADRAATIKRGGIDYYEKSYRVNLKITGENIEKVVFKVISNNPEINLYRGASGEMQYLRDDEKFPTLWGHDAYPHAEKTIKDLTSEDIQVLLDVGGYTGIKPEDLNEKQLFNLVYHNPTLETDIYMDAPANEITNSPVGNQENMYYQNWYKIYGTSKGSKEEGDKVFGRFQWDMVEIGKELSLSQEALKDKYVLYLRGLYTYDTNVNPPMDYDILGRQYFEQLSKDAKIEISIVYKNGTVKKKMLSYQFKDLGKDEFGFDSYELQGTLE